MNYGLELDVLVFACDQWVQDVEKLRLVAKELRTELEKTRAAVIDLADTRAPVPLEDITDEEYYRAIGIPLSNEF